MTTDAGDWTCGLGLAAGADLPDRLAGLVAATGAVLEAHLAAIAGPGEAAARERAAYTDLAARHRAAAEGLAALAAAMRGYRDLPPAPHDEAAMAGQAAPFERLVGATREAAAQLAETAAAYAAMLAEAPSPGAD